MPFRKYRKKKIVRLDKDKDVVNYLNITLLSKFLNERSFILPRKYTNLSSKDQRLIRKQIIIARHLHLLPYIT